MLNEFEKLLESLEAVRKRPGMHIGSTSSKGLHDLLSEIVDISIDEGLAEINVIIEEDNSITVKDNGRGIKLNENTVFYDESKGAKVTEKQKKQIKYTEKIALNQSEFNYCVITGSEYFIKILALYRSLKRESKTTFTLYICCLDHNVYNLLSQMNLENVVPLNVEDIEDDRLRKVKSERKLNEYCWTLKAPLMEYILENYNKQSILYCDGDLYFFSDPEAIFKEWGDHSVYLCPQRDLHWVEEKYGKYQAGLVGFKKDENGLGSLRWWKERCLEWCYKVPEGDKFGDQKYLDKIPQFFSNIKISQNLGVNAAPWNCIYNNNIDFTKKNQQVYLNGYPLVVYHFACLTVYDTDLFDLWSLDTLTINKFVLNEIYIPYLQELQISISRLNALPSNLRLKDYLSQYSSSNAKTLYKYTPFKREMDQYDQFYNFATIVSSKYVLKCLALHNSLVRQMDYFHLWICCVDHEAYRALDQMKLKNITLIKVHELGYSELFHIQAQRSEAEFCWTLKAPLCLYILKNYLEINHIVYCDADMFFFSHPKPLFDEWGQYSIFLCKQRGTIELEGKHGMYQAGLIGFKNEPNSLMILEWWKRKCMARCSERYDSSSNSWGDQKYLDLIPNLFENIKIIENIGINVAPWNLIMNNHHKVKVNNGKVYIDDTNLIAYHFGSLLMLNNREFDLWKHEELNINESVIKYIYTPYLKHLKNNAALLPDLYSSIPNHHTPKNYYKLEWIHL